MSGYVELWELIKRADMRSLSFHILVHKVGFIVVDAVNGLKLIGIYLLKEVLQVLFNFYHLCKTQITLGNGGQFSNIKYV